jgi:hypothetical protein
MPIPDPHPIFTSSDVTMRHDLPVNDVYGPMFSDTILYPHIDAEAFQASIDVRGNPLSHQWR